MKAIIITIGDEILIGQILDTNSQYIAQRLQIWGVAVAEMLSVADRPEAIIAAVQHSLQHADWVLITGGLGPTKDDITKATLTRYFKGNLVLNEDVLQHISQLYAQRGRSITDASRSVAYQPDNAVIFQNKKGTAPTMCWEIGTQKVISMPGVPYEMKHFMEGEVGDFLQKQIPEKNVFHYTLMTAGVGETYIAEKIKDIEGALPAAIKLAYLPSLGTVKLRLTANGNDESYWRAELQRFANAITERLGNSVFAQEDTTLEKVVGEQLKMRRALLVLAESCTGGTVAQKITSVAGSSAYFWGGVVAYSNEMKIKILHIAPDIITQHGAVSHACVAAMAQGALANSGAQYAIAISGTAGPDGGTPEKPVGTVFMAIATPQQGIQTKKHQLYTHRDINIQLAATIALNELRLAMSEEKTAATTA